MCDSKIKESVFFANKLLSKVRAEKQFSEKKIRFFGPKLF
jgi:hypothetical protein